MGKPPDRVRRHGGGQRGDRGDPADQVPPEGGTGRAKRTGITLLRCAGQTGAEQPRQALVRALEASCSPAQASC